MPAGLSVLPIDKNKLQCFLRTVQAVWQEIYQLRGPGLACPVTVSAEAGPTHERQQTGKQGVRSGSQQSTRQMLNLPPVLDKSKRA